MRLRFHPEAESEAHQAFIWYEFQRKGLGTEFVFCLDEALARIERSPLRHPIVHSGFRRIVIKRFPFSVFYELADGEIRILSVFHSRRNPDEWKSRK